MDPPLYSNDTGHNENTPPPRNSTWSGTVSVTFIYDPDKYEVDAEKKPGVDYTFDAGTPGKVTITHSYVIVEQSMDDLAAAPISPLTYKANTPQDTVLLSGVPYSSTVSWTWEEVGNQSNNGQGTETSPSDRNAMDIAPITDAGTYRVTITVEKDGFTSKTLDPITVTIAKATVTTPTAASDLQYTGKVQTGLQDPAPDALYKYVEGSQLTGTNAGPYTATAQLNDSENYRWSTGDDNGDGKVQISWNIAKRRVIETSIGTNYKSVPYIGNAYTAVGEPPRPSGLFTVTYREDGTLVGTLKETHAEAFTITNAQQTNAGTYEVIATITDFDNFYWQNHSEVESYSLGTWTINRQQINAPTITAEGAIYTGEAYAAGKVTLKHSEASDSRGSSQGIIDLENTKPNIRYYTQPTGGNGGDAPVNAGNYYAGVESDGWAFVDGKLPTNYQILGGSRAQFSISKATATMTFSPEEVTATYTAQGTDLQQVTVDGLVDADKDKPASEVYNVTYTYKYRENDSTDWEDVSETTTIEDLDTFVFMDVGQYQITAKWGAGTVSNNYTATPAIYTLTITKADEQKITLTSAGTNKGTWKPTEKTYTTTYGSEKTFTVTGTAALDAENAAISYEVTNDGANVVSVDSGSGMVTIKQAGEATITVTAAETANVGAASVEYTVTVKKAKPTVNTGLEGDELTVAYTGKAITGYNKATAAANVVEGAAKPTGDITYTFYADQECKNKVTNGGGEDNNVPIAVGTYYMKASYPGDKNYLPAESKVVTVIVTEAQLTVDAKGYTGTYDGETHSAITVKSVTGNDIQLTEGNYTVKYAKTTEEEAPAATAENVWKDALSVKDVADSTSGSQYYWYMVTADNYNPAIGKVDVKIAPAPLTVAGEPTRYTKEYDGDKAVDEAFDKITVTAENVPDVTIDVAATGTYANKNAGKDKDVTLILTLSGTDIKWGNYSYNGTELTKGEITLTQAGAGTITPKAITVTGISAENRVYDGTKVVQLTGTPETTDKVGEDNLTLALASNATGSIESADVGNDKAVTVETSVITLGGDDANNYKVSAVKDAANGDVKVNITQRPVNLEFAGIGQDGRIIEKPYTGQPVSVTVGPVTNPDEGTGFVDSDQLTADDVDYTYTPVDPTTDENHTAVGSYTVTAALKAAPTGDYDNYQLNFPAEATLEITPAEMVVTANNYTGTYTGKAHSVADSWTAKTTDSASTEIEITTVEFIKKEDDTRPEAGAEGWDEIPFINVAQSGKYWYKVTAENYAPIVGDSAVTITIDPATLTINRTVTPTKTYDGTVDADEQVTDVGVKGQQNNEAITATVTSAFYNSAEVGSASKITITYKLEAKDGANLANYKLTGKEAVLTSGTVTEEVTKVNNTNVAITQKPIEVSINDQSKVYDGQFATASSDKGTAWTVNEDDLCELVSGTKDNLGITLSVAPDSKDAGAYAITGKADNDNYKVTFTGNWQGEEHNGTAGTYTIDPRPIKVEIGDAEGFYGDEPVLDNVELVDDTEDGVSDAGLVVGEVLKDVLKGLELATAANAQSDISDDDITYPIYAKKGEAPIQAPTQLGNYEVTFTNEGTYTVKPRPITITISDAESDYGCDLAQLTYSKTLSEAYTGTNKGVVFVGDDETDLKIALFTTAKKGSDAGTYSISGKVSDGDVSENYSITWAGETSWNGSDQDSTTADSAKGTYTIDKAQLKVSVKRSDIYAQYGEEISNPVTFTNASTGQEIASDASDYTALSQAITYGMEPQGGLTQVEGSENAEGKFTVAVTQQMVTVTVNVAATENYEAATEITYHIHASASGSLDVSLPFADLTYNGQPQQLLAQAPELPDGVYIRYKVGESGEWTAYSDKNQDNWKEVVGENAGSYTVYWETTSSGNYNASSGNSNTSIAKANLEGSFAHDSYPHVLATDGNNYDSAEKNPLTITSQNYKANPANYTYYSDNMKVASSANGTSTIVITGTAGESATIRVTVPGDNNYNEGTFTYRLEISDDLSKIVYSVGNQEVTYNGQPQTIAVNVTEPDSGATVMYWNESTNAYDQTEPPAYTNVQEGGYPIKFQITAPGYKTVTDEATLKIEPKKITETIIAGIAGSYTYTGKEITFDDAISLHDEGVLLKQDTDYTIDYGDNKEVGTGSVIIKGTGNYTGSVTKEFEITPVDASDLTASLNRTFGYYRNSENNNATVTVTHGGHTVDSREIALTVTRQDSTIESGDVVKEGLKLTFNKAGIYTIHVVVSGTHKGAFDLTYTLLPQDVASDDFQVATDPVDRVWTYDGGNHAFGVTVTSGGTPLQKDVDFTLRYTYLPYVGSQEENEYDPESTEFTEAGIYTVIVKGTGNYTGHAELVALIQPRDLSDADIAAVFAQTGLVYNGEAQEPEVALTYNGTAINQLKNTEYYGNTNAGEAQALSAAREDCNNFTGARVDAFTIEKKSLNDSTITAKADPEKYYYTGYPVTPAVTVTDSGRNVGLSIGADYTVSSDAVGPGKVTATVTGTGNYKDTVTVEFTILPTGAEPVETLNLTVTPSEWTWDNGQTKAAISVTFNGKELNDADYELTVSKDGETPKTVTKAEAVELLSAPGTYTITATGVGAYNGSTDTETVTIQKIQPEVTVTATPNSLSGGGKVTLTLKGEKLPAFAEGQDLSSLLTASAKDEKNAPDLSELEWETDKQTGVMTAELTLPNTSETYTFTLTFTGNEYYEAATASEQVVVAQQIISGGGGGPVEDQPADPDDTGVSDWLNTKDHLAYLAGYPGGTFGPDQNMTRAEAAQMFYNLLLEKDVEITVEFEDVPADAWYAKPVNTLASLGILSGVGNGRFDPERSITRAEFTVIAMKFANTSGGGVNIFSDVNEDDWFYSAVVDSTQYGWINGYPDGTFRPEATISRAEVTVIVNHMLGRAADRPYVIAHEEELNTFGDVNRGHWGYFHIAEATNAHEYHTEDGTESWTGLS